MLLFISQQSPFVDLPAKTIPNLWRMHLQPVGVRRMQRRGGRDAFWQVHRKNVRKKNRDFNVKLRCQQTRFHPKLTADSCEIKSFKELNPLLEKKKKKESFPCTKKRQKVSKSGQRKGLSTQRRLLKRKRWFNSYSNKKQKYLFGKQKGGGGGVTDRLMQKHFKSAAP